MDNYISVGMWKAEGTLTPYPSGDPGAIYNYNHGTLYGSFAGSFDAGTASIFGSDSGGYGYPGQTTFLMNEVSGQSLDWGIYNLRLGAGNTFSGKPSGDAGWSAAVGGTGDFGYRYESGYENGYWLAQAGGIWYASGEVSGSLYNGIYLTDR